MIKCYHVVFENVRDVEKIGQQQFGYYVFKSDLELAKDTIVVCETRYGLAVGKVMEEVKFSDKATKWIVCVVDMTEHTKRIEKMAKLESIMQQMEARKKQVESHAIYELLAEKDDELKKLLVVYKELLD